MRAAPGQWHSSESRPVLLGHRGARHAAPENTLAAFELAIEEGAEGVELDVRFNRSGEVVVAHDDSLERVTGGADPRRVSRLSSAECGEIRLQGERLPSLEQVLDWALQRRALLNIELKADTVARHRLALEVARLLRRHPVPAAALLVSSFDPRLVRQHRRAHRSVDVAWLFESRVVASLPWLPRAAAVHPHYALLKERRARGWKRLGFRIHCWTVNDTPVARNLARWGVDALISDRPGPLRKELLDESTAQGD